MSRLALKIVDIRPNVGEQTHALSFADARVGPITVSHDWVALHEPEVGGYYVIDDAGRAAFSEALPDDVPAPPTAVAEARIVHPADHFQYDWLQKWLELFYAQGEALLASHDALQAELVALKARVDAR